MTNIPTEPSFGGLWFYGKKMYVAYKGSWLWTRRWTACYILESSNISQFSHPVHWRGRCGCDSTSLIAILHSELELLPDVEELSLLLVSSVFESTEF